MIRVLIVSRYPLFSQGIWSMLCHQDDLEIVGCESDPGRAMQRINDLEPDVVIADNHDSEWSPASLVRRILKEAGSTTVIGLDLEDNTLRVFHEEQRTAQGIQDLVDAIRANASHKA